MYAAKCESLVKDFQSGNGFQRVLFGIDLVIPFGKITLLAGPSGCGKTTILSILAGLLDPTSGNAEVLGKDIGRMRGRQKVAFRGKNIGFVFQQYNLLPALTACENVAVPLVILGQARSKAIELARQTLVKVGLEDKMDSIPKNLSGGQQQRVAIARALVHQPRLLLCDEPTAALDAASGHTVMELLREVALVPERAVVIVTHDNRVYSFGDRMIRIADGRVEQTLEDPSSFTAKVF